MKQKIVFATGNEGKMREIRAILGDLGMEVISMRAYSGSQAREEDSSCWTQNWSPLL